MSETRSHYVHGTDPEEQQRLTRLNDLLNDGSIRELRLTGGERILDLGCGTGQLTRRIAAAAGATGRVLGIDRSEEQLEQARRPASASSEAAIEFRAGDVLALDLAQSEWGSFDVAHTRFLLEHLPDPLTVVRSMVRAVKPGGRIVLEDEDHEIMRLWPEPVGFRETWEAYIESYRRAGNDPHIGKRMIELLCAAGAEPRRNACIWFGCAAGDPMFETWVANLLGVLRGARDSILATGRMHESTFNSTLETVQAWGRRDDAAAWYFMAWAEGCRPKS
jgi:ubiquinone/menaquinone biosynthesis C-methylase UbiE